MTDAQEPRVLVVDDDTDLTVMLSDYLKAEGFQVTAVHDGETGVARALSGDYDAVILDVMMPRLSGTEALRRIRTDSPIPVIMLTAKGDDIDRVVGLELGADDYVPKPYFPRELVARLRAVLRRRPAASPPPQAAQSLDLGSLRVDIATRRALARQVPVELTASEFNLLVVLLQASDRVVTKDELSLKVLGRARASYDRSVDVHVSNLRQKLGVAAPDIEIETVRGVGYRIVTSR
jgi:two-component system OmpR family response regulator